MQNSYVRTCHDFAGAEEGDLSFKVGDVLYVDRQIDGSLCHGHSLTTGLSGIFPTNFVSKLVLPHLQQSSAGEKKLFVAKERFIGQEQGNLSFVEGDIIVGMRAIDENWWNGEAGGRQGIFPLTLVIELNPPNVSSFSTAKDDHNATEHQGDLEPEATVYMKRQSRLTSVEAHAILSAADRTKFSLHAPYKPNGGEIYIYEASMSDHHVGDGYRWQCSTGFQPLPTRQRVLIYRKAKKLVTSTSGQKGDSRFIVYLYRLSDQLSPLMVHYVGDQSIYQPLPHKSAIKCKDREFIRSAPTVGQKAKSDLKKCPQQLYEEILCEPKPLQPAYQPRDRKQVENFQHAERLKNQLSHDSLYNLYTLGFEFSDFVKEYRADFNAENNVVFLAHPALLQKLNQLLDPPVGLYSNLVETFYDTTFQIGQFYVSVFAFRHFMLSGRPTIPAAFFLHQRKFSCDHAAFLMSLVKSCPNLATKRFALITDREFRDVSNIFPKAQHLYCWNHIRRDVRFWTNQKAHRTADYQRRGETGTYAEDIYELLRMENSEAFEEKLAQQEKVWATKFVAYFNEHLKCDMLSKSCRWIVETTGLYDKWSGITSNAIESVNAVFSRSFGEPMKMDEAVLGLYYLAGYYNFEVNRGLCNVGNYHLDDAFHAYKQDVGDVQRGDVFPPEMIVKNVKDKLAKSSHSQPSSLQGRSFDGTGAQDPLDDSSKVANIRLEKSKTDGLDFTRKMKEKLEQRACKTQLDSAKVLCEQKKVTLVSERGVFVVEGGRDRKYCVTVFPKETCQCPATTTCYHIIAARLAIDASSGGRKNITRLFQKSRKFADRRIGFKKPNKKDTAPPQDDEPTVTVSTEVPENSLKRSISYGAVPESKKTKLWDRLTEQLPEYNYGVYGRSFSMDDSEGNKKSPMTKLHENGGEQLESRFAQLKKTNEELQMKALEMPAGVKNQQVIRLTPLEVGTHPSHEKRMARLPKGDGSEPKALSTEESPTIPIEIGSKVPRSPKKVPSSKKLVENKENAEPSYCLCKKGFYGKMIGCDNVSCEIKWFHFGCVGLRSKPVGDWFCHRCSQRDPEWIDVITGNPKQFTFRSVSTSWMSSMCVRLKLPLHGSRRNGMTASKAAFDSPPKKTKTIVRDGNCLFRTFSHVVTNSEEHYREMRELICEQIAKNARRYLGDETADSYFARTQMRQDTTWGTDIELRAAADLFETTIWVYGPQPGRFVWIEFKSSVSTSDKLIFIVNRGYHFEPLYKW